MPEQLTLFVDEYPADLYQSKIFCMSVANVPDGFRDSPGVLDELAFLKATQIQIYLGCVDSKEEPRILDYLKRRIFAVRDKIRGINMFWSTVAIYCIFGYIVHFYKYTQPPPIHVIHDPKSMAKDHQNATYNFIKNEIPKWFNTFTQGIVQPKILTVQEGQKNSIGVRIADFVSREYITNGVDRLKSVDSIKTQNISHYLAENPKQLQF